MLSVNRTDVWKMHNGEYIKLEDMDHTHRENVMNMLYRQGENLRNMAVWDFTLEVAMHDGGDMAHDALESELERMETQPFEEFFNGLPLIKRLKELNLMREVQLFREGDHTALRRIPNADLFVELERYGKLAKRKSETRHVHRIRRDALIVELRRRNKSETEIAKAASLARSTVSRIA